MDASNSSKIDKMDAGNTVFFTDIFRSRKLCTCYRIHYSTSLYTVILVSKILHAKKEWHTDPQTSKISGDKNIQKMSDFLEKMDALAEEE